MPKSKHFCAVNENSSANQIEILFADSMKEAVSIASCHNDMNEDDNWFPTNYEEITIYSLPLPCPVLNGLIIPNNIPYEYFHGVEVDPSNWGELAND